jgi:excinuclease ABC subunit A
MIALRFSSRSNSTKREAQIAERVMKEVHARLGFLLDVGLDYLSLARPAATLSGGEAQRIRLATQIGSGLVGVLYVLDEPSIGLHQRDNVRLIETLNSIARSRKYLNRR